jgi:hypothetical protein
MRVPDWPERLEAYLAACRDRRFVWGEHDCVCFAAGWVAQATGTDPAPHSRGVYDSPETALETLWRCYSTADLVAAVTTVLGTPLDSPRLARRGDLAAVPTSDGPALGVVVGARIACLARPAGLTFPSLTKAIAAWRID